MPSALDYFNIQPPGNPLSQFFPQPGGDDAFRAQLEERPRAGAGLPPEVALAYQTQDPSGFLDQVQKIRSGLQSQNIVKGLQSLDFNSKDYSKSVASLLGKNSLGAGDKTVQEILRQREFSGAQAKDKSYSDDAAKAFKALSSIPQDDPDYEKKVNDLAQSTEDHVFTNPQFASLYERSKNHVESLRARKGMKKDESQKLGLQLAEAGIHPDNFDQYQDDDGNLNPLKVAYALGQAKRGLKSDAAPMSSGQREKLAKSFEDFHAPISDEDALDAYNVANKTKLNPNSWFSKPSDQQIEQGRALAQTAKTKSMMSKLAAMHEAGVSLPDAFQSFLGASDAPQPGPATLTAPGHPSAPTAAGAPQKAPVITAGDVTPPVLASQASQLPPMPASDTADLLESNKEKLADQEQRKMVDQGWTAAKSKMADLVNKNITDPDKRLRLLMSAYKAQNQSPWKALLGPGEDPYISGFSQPLGKQFDDISPFNDPSFEKAFGKTKVDSNADFLSGLSRFGGFGRNRYGSPEQVLAAHAEDELRKAGYIGEHGQLINPALKTPLQRGQSVQTSPNVVITHVGP